MFTKKVTVPFFICHQGCPHDCLFCNQRSISGSEGVLPTTEEITAKVLAWRATAGQVPLEVAFFGGSFTALHPSIQDALLASLSPFIISGDVTTIRVSTRPDCIDTETVRRIAEQGVGIIELGVQSMDNIILDAAGRGHSSDDSIAAIKCIKKQGLSVGAQLMPGLPGDTLTVSMASLDKVIMAGADFIRLYPVVVLSGTGLAHLYEKGKYVPPSIEDGILFCKNMLHRAVTSGVNVIRIGLQASEGLNAETIIAGCFHPALGHMVKSELFFDTLCKIFSMLDADVPVTILCHPNSISEVNGYKGRNLKRLISMGFRSVTVKSGFSCSRNDVEVTTVDGKFIDNIYNPLLYKGEAGA